MKKQTLRFLNTEYKKSLDAVKNAWKDHPMSTEKNQTSFQIWTPEMIDCNNENQRAARDFLLTMMNQTRIKFRCEELISVKSNIWKAYLKEKFDPFYEDNNNGINLFVQVKEEVTSSL